MGIIHSVIGVGILILVPSIQYLIIHVGWRMAYRIMAVGISLFIISMVISLLRESPSSVPFQSQQVVSRSEQRCSSGAIGDETSQTRTIRKVIATKEFWLINLFYLLGSSSNQTITAHQVAFFVDEGLEVLFASYVVGLLGIISIGGIIL